MFKNVNTKNEPEAKLEYYSHLEQDNFNQSPWKNKRNSKIENVQKRKNLKLKKILFKFNNFPRNFHYE